MALEVMVNRVLVFLLNSALSGLWVLWEATSAKVKSNLQSSAAAGVLIIMTNNAPFTDGLGRTD